jgi:hypothetical protein
MEKPELLTGIVENFGVQIRMYREPFAALEEFDKGLRSRIFQTFDTGRLKEFIRSIEPATMCFTEDLYGCHYCFFTINGLSSESSVINREIDGGGGGGGGLIKFGPLVLNFAQQW